MSRTNVDVDDEALAVVMARYHLATKREAINFALRKLVDEPMAKEEILAMRGSGWGDGLELDDLYADGGVELI
ncbi:MAG: type II toxin-antitoxin system VapB family antitoxin [Acidimicrobiales bacterium]